VGQFVTKYAISGGQLYWSTSTCDWALL